MNLAEPREPTRMPPKGLTVLARLRPGADEPLRAVLRAIGDDIRGTTLQGAGTRPHIHFSSSRRIHFARFAILDDPDAGPGRRRLLFSSNYDGELDDHLAEVAGITTDMSAIWGGCEGYTGLDTFGSFIRAHAYEPAAFYIAFRDGRVQEIRRCLAVRQSVQTCLDSADAAALAAALTGRPGDPQWIRSASTAAKAAAREIADGASRLSRALPIAADVIEAVAASGFAEVFRATKKIIASLGRSRVIRLFNSITRNALPPRTSPYSSVGIDNCAPLNPLVPGDEIPSSSGRGTPPTFREDIVTQNQLTLVTVVDPPRVRRVTAVLAVIDSYAKRLSPPGSLIGISTIHFVRWLLIDEGRRLMLLSDYDGSWESYIDEFAEMILSGLDAIWDTSLGYPVDGARDLPAFKRFLRAHQVPSEVFFSAYPNTTVLNITQDRELADALGNLAGAQTSSLSGSGQV